MKISYATFFFFSHQNTKKLRPHPWHPQDHFWLILIREREIGKKGKFLLFSTLHLGRQRVTTSSSSTQPTPPLIILPTSNNMPADGSDHFFFYEKDCVLWFYCIFCFEFCSDCVLLYFGAWNKGWNFNIFVLNFLLQFIFVWNFLRENGLENE